MKIDNIKNYKNGWIIGNFYPSLLHTEQFEIAVQFHPKGFIGKRHYHVKSTEYNYVIRGKMKICGKLVETGDIFIFYPSEISESEFLEDTTLLIIKTPSDPNDKYFL